METGQGGGEGLRRPRVRLSGEDGNAFAILGRVRRALREAGHPESVVRRFSAEATAGDYGHLLRTVEKWADVE